MNSKPKRFESKLYQIVGYVGVVGIIAVAFIALATQKQVARNQIEPPNQIGLPEKRAELDARFAELGLIAAKQQLAKIASNLKEFNPGFDGVLTGLDNESTPQIEDGLVTELKLNTDNITNLAPLQSLTGLKALVCSGSAAFSGKITDLSPLRRMSLQQLDCGMSQVSDLSPLMGMPLTELRCSGTRVADLSPLKDLPLILVHCDQTSVSDLTPLANMKLTELMFSPGKIEAGIEAIRKMDSLKTIATGRDSSERYSAEDFWKKYDAGEFGTP